MHGNREVISSLILSGGRRSDPTKISLPNDLNSIQGVMGDDAVGVGQTGTHVLFFKIWIVFQYVVSRLSLGQETQDQLD